MKNRFKNFVGKGAGVDVSPLIDMVFILLVFFIVTTVFVDERGLAMQTSAPRPPDTAIELAPLVFTIAQSGAFYLRGSEMRLEGVASAIRDARIAGNLETVIIDAHPQSKVLHMAQLLDTCAAYDVPKVVTKATPF